MQDQLTGLRTAQAGAVVIGRNEGDRLRRSLASLLAEPAFVGRADLVVYVDSGSTDGSVEFARSLGVGVAALDLATPFTAARARNAGVAELRARDPERKLRFVQFVDGDCTLAPGWIAAALQALARDPELAVVCGRRREVAPEASAYNRLCDMEWNTPVGPAAACGGDSMMRLEALHAVGGFNPALIAGEEPDLCFRLRRAGWRVLRLDAEMTRHDAAIHRFGQWWRRCERGGWAYAEGVALHGDSPERYNRRQLRSAVLWGGAAPAATVAGVAAAATASPMAGVAAVGAAMAAFSLMTARIALGRRRRFQDPWSDALLYAGLTLVAKPAQLQGALRFWRQRRRGETARLIEYKDR